jgi:hypothetical protein
MKTLTDIESLRRWISGTLGHGDLRPDNTAAPAARLTRMRDGLD